MGKDRSFARLCALLKMNARYGIGRNGVVCRRWTKIFRKWERSGRRCRPSIAHKRPESWGLSAGAVQPGRRWRRVVYSSGGGAMGGGIRYNGGGYG